MIDKNNCDDILESCNAWCCRFVEVNLKGVIDEDLKKWCDLRGIIVKKNSMRIPCPCKNISVLGYCRDYENRPESCKTYMCYDLAGKEVLKDVKMH